MKTTDKPTLQEFHIEGVRHILPDDAFELLKNKKAVLIDVREQNEVAIENVPLDNVLNHPMPVILDRLKYITKDQVIIVACPGGVRSVKVANLLNREGYPEVANLDGGFSQWKAKGMPWQISLSIADACGCGCGDSNSGNGGSCC